MTEIEWEEHVANLPDPTRDPMPPRVEFTEEGEQQAQEDRRFKQALLNTKKDTERAAKYILESRLFGGNFRKDGDWVTLPSGREVYQKKVSDLVGGIPLRTRPNAHTFVEVKGISPGQSFAFSRLDKRNNPRQPSQFEKLMGEWELGNLVWLFLGWWDSEAAPIMVRQGSREVRKWRKADCEMTGTLLRWGDWLEIYYGHKYRSIRQRDRHLLDDYRITKTGGRWTLDRNHWWLTCR
jgi:hypothetical protein